MKRVLFHYPILNVGGAEKSSLRMIKALADRGWDVTLVLTTGGGMLEPEIDPRVRVVRLRPSARGNRFLSARSLGARVRALPDLAAYGLFRAWGSLRMIPFLFRRYDAGVVLSISLDTRFVRRFVRCRVRIHWIRNDFAGNFPARARATRMIASGSDDFDHYICVSQVTRASLIAAIPQIARKARVVYNILDADRMREQAREPSSPFPELSSQTAKVLTVCRLKENSKGLLRMVRICRRLEDTGCDFVWFIGGDGPDRALLEKEIEESGLKRRMILLGYLKNPFPAYKEADLVAMLSYYEGLCGVVNEAKVMGCAVLATEVSGIREQLQSGRNGIVVENDEDAIFAAMRRLLESPEDREMIRNTIYPAGITDDVQKLDQIESLLLGRAG